jgi:hypothetical protein
MRNTFTNTIIILLIICATGCSRARQAEPSHRSAFRQLWSVALTPAQGDEAPKSLSQFPSRLSDGRLFACPEHSEHLGAIEAVDKWTDLIYIGGLRNYEGEIAMFICPPENHKSTRGYAILAGGRFLELTPPEAKALVAKPWLYAVNLNPADLEVITNHIQINVPPIHKAIYGP